MNKRQKAIQAHSDTCEKFKWYMDRFAHLRLLAGKKHTTCRVYVIDKFKYCPFCGDDLNPKDSEVFVKIMIDTSKASSLAVFYDVLDTEFETAKELVRDYARKHHYGKKKWLST